MSSFLIEMDNESQISGQRISWLVLGMIGYGASLALHEDFHSFWFRTFIAAVGGGMLGHCLSQWRSDDEFQE